MQHTITLLVLCTSISFMACHMEDGEVEMGEESGDLQSSHFNEGNTEIIRQLSKVLPSSFFDEGDTETSKEQWQLQSSHLDEGYTEIIGEPLELQYNQGDIDTKNKCLCVFTAAAGNEVVATGNDSYVITKQCNKACNSNCTMYWVGDPDQWEWDGECIWSDPT